MKRKALIVWGGWKGHQPQEKAERFKIILKEKNFEVEISNSLNSFNDKEKLKTLHLIIPIWTMGEIDNKHVNNIIEAVASGTGIAGCHGGMCDTFRSCPKWQFMTGGQFVAHPGGDKVEYVVNIKSSSSHIVEGVKDFKVLSEQYYLHVDPAIEVLATTTFPVAKSYHSPNGEVQVPVIWTKKWGHGRVFYNSLGHNDDMFDIPEIRETMTRGFIWAAEGKDIAVKQGLDGSIFR